MAPLDRALAEGGRVDAARRRRALPIAQTIGRENADQRRRRARSSTR